MIVEPPRWRDPAGPPLLAESPYDQQPEPGRPNPYWQGIRSLPLDRDAAGYAGTGHAIPTPADIDWIAAVLDGRSVVEVGAGTGTGPWQLSMAGAGVSRAAASPAEELRRPAAGPTEAPAIRNQRRPVLETAIASTARSS
ncbi:hypothetical protein [Amycolatopsis sp. NPDC004079]|uniref:hypothetical protein n=1 Tax=Amycolatopsis sp. NPDC004079 TaxID=3154549 RepID=UPI0033A7B334